AAVSPGSGCDHDESPVDQERLQELRGDDPDQLRELVDLYLAQADELIGALGAAIETSSAREIERLAHKFVGSSVTCGMTAIVAPLRELEQAGRTGQLANVAQSHAQARQQLDRINRFFKPHLEAGSTV